jgi:hypothetical protein
MQHLKVDPQENGINIQEFLQHLNHYAVVDMAQKVFN